MKKVTIEVTKWPLISIKTLFTEQPSLNTINDGGGLFMFVGATGGKLWRFVYPFGGKRKKIAFGAYPETTLENARRKAEEARTQIANGIDPGEIRKVSKASRQLARLNEERIE